MVATVAMLGMLVITCDAQDLTPRAYWPSPKGTMVAVFGYAYNWGDILTDPSLPVEGVDSRIHTALIAYVQTLSVWGRTANVLVEVPYVWGTTVGSLEKSLQRKDVSGLGDIGITVAVNLLGAPSMTLEEFQQLRSNPHLILGASLKIIVPTGAYDTEKLINVGQTAGHSSRSWASWFP